MTNTRQEQHLRRIEEASANLTQAEQLWQILNEARLAHPNNWHIAQAYDEAGLLCAEVEADMINEMDNAGLDSIDPADHPLLRPQK